MARPATERTQPIMPERPFCIRIMSPRDLDRVEFAPLLAAFDRVMVALAYETPGLSASAKR